MRDWVTVPSPFLSPRAQLRAPQALAFAGVTGAAMVISRRGEVALFSGTVNDLDAGHLARLAVRSLGAADADPVSFSHEGCCVHASSLGFGWTLCVVSTIGVTPVAVRDRLMRARRFLTIALRDGRVVAGGGPDGGGSGAPAEVWAFAPLQR